MDRKTQAFAAAQRIIDAIWDAGFDDLRDIMNVQMGMVPDFIQWQAGATRLVIWDDECDYVVKVALDHWDEKYNKHEVEVYAEAEKAGFSDMFGWCAQYTEGHGEKETFVPGVYVMEFLDGCEDEVIDSAYSLKYDWFCEQNGLDPSDFDSRDKYAEYKSGDGYQEDDEEIMELLTEGMSVSETYDFNSFIYEHEVNDIHSGNILMKNGRFAFCDYAGYGW